MSDKTCGNCKYFNPDTKRTNGVGECTVPLPACVVAAAERDFECGYSVITTAMTSAESCPHFADRWKDQRDVLDQIAGFTNKATRISPELIDPYNRAIELALIDAWNKVHKDLNTPIPANEQSK